MRVEELSTVRHPTSSFNMDDTNNARVRVLRFLRLVFFFNNGFILTFHTTVLYHCASTGGMIGTGMCTVYTVQALSTRSPPTRIRRLSSARTDRPSVRQYVTRMHHYLGYNLDHYLGYNLDMS